MHVHPIRPDELARFAAAATRAEYHDSIQHYLDRMIAQGAMRSDWCWVADSNGSAVGRVGGWALPQVGIPGDLVLLDLDWEGDFLTVGITLVREAIRSFRALGAAHIGHVIDAPPQAPQWQNYPEQRHALLTTLGFAIERETRRFEWAGSTPPAQNGRLTYRPLPEVGEAAFLDALQQVSSSTLDQRITHEREEKGGEQDARDMFTDLQGMEYDPAWWQLAYDDSETLVGLLMPTKAPSMATIGYIGVVPEQRGRGYIHDLLARSTALLLETGASTIRADTDVANMPMANAFLRAGYREFAMRREYGLKAELAV